ncbi:hypothetical protein [Listeria goaensis]|uniref:hypothetical protein n=1 Tax=Listeria goaensis TaxID=1649188 RepID=UPI000B5942CC|nr:hypothetical protein [Listeria goaensis]
MKRILKIVPQVEFWSRIMVYIGGFLGLYLFYPPLVKNFYTYLTTHGFHDPSLKETLFIIPQTVITILAFFAFFQILFLIQKMSLRNGIAVATRKLLANVGNFGFIIGCLYALTLNMQQQVYIIWLWFLPVLFCTFLNKISPEIQKIIEKKLWNKRNT